MSFAQSTAVFWSVVDCAVDEVGAFSFEVEGWSMLPVLRPKDLVTIRRLLWPHVRPGDIVLGQTERGATLHRVRTIQGVRQGGSASFDYVFWTQGDASQQVERMPVEAYVGIAESAYRGNRRLPLRPY